jgi:hypothetical protein
MGGMAAASVRPAAWACAAVLALAGCSYGADEPGLFRSPRPSVEDTTVPGGRFTPQPTNPELPVLGERLWVSGFNDVPVTIRIAVHAVRRTEGATVLDWSVTPIAAPGFGFGEQLPPNDLGMEPGTRSSPAITLLDVAGRRAYQPLVHSSREEFNHCLCTPMLRVQPALRVGETRLLQVAFPVLPDSLLFVDVGWNTVAPFWHVPVSPVGTAPVAVRPTDLARPEEVLAPGPAKLDFANPSGSEQIQRIQITRVLAAPGRATLEWRLTSMTPHETRVLDYRPPVESTTPLGMEVLGSSQASGPVLRAGGIRLHNEWSRTKVFNRDAYECQCTEIGLWASGLRDAGGSATLVTSYPGLPPGTETVDVEFPGFGTFRRLPVTPADDAAAEVEVSRPVTTGRWTYDVADPPYGWPTAEWPTDLPDPAQLAEYQSNVDPLVPLPAAR